MRLDSESQNVCLIYGGALLSLIFVYTRPPSQGNLVLGNYRLEVHPMLISLCLKVWPEVLVRREALVVLQVVCQSQAGVEGVNLEGPLCAASPLPSSMHSLGIQDIIWGEQEARGEEPEEHLELAVPLPQEDRRSCFRKVYEVLPQNFCCEEVLLELCSVGGPGRCEVSGEGPRCPLSNCLISRQQLGCQPGISECCLQGARGAQKLHR